LPALCVALVLGPGNRHRPGLETTAHQQMTVDVELGFVAPIAEVPQAAGQLLAATFHDEKWLGSGKEIGVLATRPHIPSVPEVVRSRLHIAVNSAQPARHLRDGCV
jgi:hypothetical protein